MQLFPSLSLLNQRKLFDSLNPILTFKILLKQITAPTPPPKTPSIKLLLYTRTKTRIPALVSARKSN
jgi:hypothetical protein